MLTRHLLWTSGIYARDLQGQRAARPRDRAQTGSGAACRPHLTPTSPAETPLGSLRTDEETEVKQAKECPVLAQPESEGSETIAQHKGYLSI